MCESKKIIINRKDLNFSELKYQTQLEDGASVRLVTCGVVAMTTGGRQDLRRDTWRKNGLC